MGNKKDEEDKELEMLRQAALKSLQRNKELRQTSSGRRIYPHRPTSHNKNLIEIQTQEDNLEHCLQEIVLAEGDDVDDSDVDEVIEEVIMSSEEEEEEAVDPKQEGEKNLGQSDSEVEEEDEVQDEEDDDEDALSVASRYSLDDLMGDDTANLLPVKVKLHNSSTSITNKSSQRNRSNSPRRRRSSRSRSPFHHPARRRRTRSRSKSPFRKRTRKSRSRSRDRRRSISRERERTGGRLRRKQDNSRPRSPTMMNRRDRDHALPPSRRRSRSLSRQRTSTLKSKREINTFPPPRSKKSPSPLEPRHVQGVDEEVLKKRREKFQGRETVQGTREKKIKLSSKKRMKEEDEEIAVTSKGNSAELRSDTVESPPSPTSIKVCVETNEAPEPQEDLRSKLIKRKLRTQPVGPAGRIFSEALKGTQLVPKQRFQSQISLATGKTKDKDEDRRGRNKRDSTCKSVHKRKVSLTYA